MKDRTLKYSEEYIRISVEDLKRDFETRMVQLKQHHDEALNKWRKDPELTNALEAAYRDELDQLKSSFLEKVEDIKQEVDSLIDESSERLKQQLDTFRSKIQELFRFINQTAIVLASSLLLRPEDFFE